MMGWGQNTQIVFTVDGQSAGPIEVTDKGWRLPDGHTQ